MRRTIAVLAGLMVAGASAYAGPEIYPIYIKLGTSSGGTQTLENVKGFVEAVFVSASDGGATGQVSVTYTPLDGINAAIPIATNAVTGKKVWRPRVDGTDAAGGDLTSDPPGRIGLVGETVTFIVTGSATGKTWRANIVVDKR